VEAISDWFNRISKEVNSYRDSLSKKDFRKYKLDLLLRIAQRVDSFSSTCQECRMFQQEISSLIKDIGNLAEMPNKERQKSYFKTINNVVKHLQKDHGLITEGQNIGIWISIGMAIGVAIGAGSGNIGLGISIGLVTGTAIGVTMDAKAKREGKVI
jgi:hypothetical protein